MGLLQVTGPERELGAGPRQPEKVYPEPAGKGGFSSPPQGPSRGIRRIHGFIEPPEHVPTVDAGSMPHTLPIDEHGFIRFADVRLMGRQSELHGAVARGELEVARRGVYRATSSAPEPDDDQLGVAGRERLAYLSNVRSVAYAFDSAVFTSYSAAVLLGLPIIGKWPSEVFILSRGKHGRRRSGVVEVARTRPIDVIEVDGCIVTSVESTLLQLARHAPLVAALTAMDAALHVPRFGDAAPMTTLEQLRAEHERLKPYPRSRRAAAVLDRATTLADTPLESGSRLLIEELGFAEPELQHELWLPELGRQAFLDFYWPDVDVGAEADGRGKYRGPLDVSRVAPSVEDAAASAARHAADAVIDEKDRENAVRRQVTGFDRWDWTDMRRKHPVEARLVRLGVPKVRRPTILI